jgi:acyl-CoA thioesterase I
MNQLTSSALISIVLFTNVAGGQSSPQATIANPIAVLTIISPLPHSVTQRSGAGGVASIPVTIDPKQMANDVLTEYRLIPLPNPQPIQAWRLLPKQPLQVVAGLYRLDVRQRRADTVVAAGAVESFGVGDLYLVAGQSYATNSNDETLKTQAPIGMVTAYDSIRKRWAIANDPQPVIDGSRGGSIWPIVGDQLHEVTGVPIGFANLAWGGTSTHDWLANDSLKNPLARARKELGCFKAVLWQQGESDVIAKTTQAGYVENLKTIRQRATAVWSFAPPWYLAKSTHHPTVYDDPRGEGSIRAAVDELVQKHGFRAGPDTDTLRGANRGGPKSARHFSPSGQRNAATLWSQVLARDSVAEWRPLAESPIIERESCVLLKTEANGAITARLAFPAKEIISIAPAVGGEVIPSANYQLGTDPWTINFVEADPNLVIRLDQRFVPKGTPQSYGHKLGDPNTNLIYRPGRWFHDRNIEVTYTRKDAPGTPLDGATEGLPKTLAKLRRGAALTIGISGDSISVGADASIHAKAPPLQPGYASLVVRGLQAAYPSSITLINRSVSGWSVANGVGDLGNLIKVKPDLIIIAYGMNDVSRRDAVWFRETTRSIVNRIQKELPDSEMILVAPMLGDREWQATPREQFALYRDELSRLTGPGIVLADVTEVWRKLLERKHDFDLTGNGLNHPNDFGHRVYARTVLSRLLPAAEPMTRK